MFDVTIVIAGVQSLPHEDPEGRGDGTVQTYASTKIYRMDLDGEPDAIRKFVQYLQDYEGTAAIEVMQGYASA